MRRNGGRLVADDVHHDGAVYTGIFQDGGCGVAQAVKGEGVHGAAFETSRKKLAEISNVQPRCSTYLLREPDILEHCEMISAVILRQ
jgi:hypothetical protein